MAILVTAYFQESGVPKTGLSPTVDIYKTSDSSLVVDDDAMTEIAGGFYKYSFTGHDTSEDYTFIVDSVTLTNDERFAVGDLDSDLTGIRPATDLLIAAQSEPGLGAPAVNATPLAKIAYMFKSWRNRSTNNGQVIKHFADDGTTVDHRRTVSESGGTVNRGEVGSG